MLACIDCSIVARTLWTISQGEVGQIHIYIPVKVVYGSVVRRCSRTVPWPYPACCSEGLSAARRSRTGNPWAVMMMVNMVMLVVRERILRCEFWAVDVGGTLDGPDIPRLRSTLNICICVCCAFKYGGNALKQGAKGIVGLTSTHRR